MIARRKKEKKKSIPTISQELSKSEKQMFIQGSHTKESTWGESQAVNPRDTNPTEWKIQKNHIFKNLKK